MGDSHLRPHMERFNSWLESNIFIGDCINDAEEVVLKSSIKKRDKDKIYEMLDSMRWDDDPGLISLEENERRKNELVRYLWNALLKFEGHGV